MIHYQPYRSGRLFGIRYYFEAAGDALPAHTHEPWDLHNFVMLKGSCLFVAEGVCHQIKTGDVFDFDGRVAHRIEAVEPSEAISFFLNGEPLQYVNLPVSELSGSIGQ